MNYSILWIIDLARRQLIIPLHIKNGGMGGGGEGGLKLRKTQNKRLVHSWKCKQTWVGILTINVPVVYMGGAYGFGWEEIHDDGRLKGWALKYRLFLGPDMASSAASAIWVQKSRDFRAHSFKRHGKWISPHPNPYVQSHIKKQVHW